MQNDLLKRLDIIKNAVAMEEDDLIDMQLQKLKQLPLDDKALLEQRINALRERINLLNTELKRIIDSEIYQRIQEIDDKENYFSQLKQELEIELVALQQEPEISI